MSSNGMHVIVTLVEDKPGVLFKVTSLIRRRNFNIATITVGSTEQEGISRMTFTIYGQEEELRQVVYQLDKLVEVISIVSMKPENMVIRELALIKMVMPNNGLQTEVIEKINRYRGHVVDMTPRTITVELVDTPEKIDSFIREIGKINIVEIARTGITAVVKGAEPTIKEVGVNG
ncbi:MAG: acetolactate synthase small subunit [Candidatus Jordarchaeales archaeon]|nr:acetolactate synthase small subunit [Candidatus Jordarchaeia archaeon]